MQHIPVKGAIWARRYLRKTQKLCFSLSIRKDRLFIRKVVLIQTNFRRNLLCEAKWAVGIKTTAQSGEVSESVPHLQVYMASERDSSLIVALHYDDRAKCKHAPIQVYTTTAPATLFFTAFFFSSAKISTLSKMPKREGIRKITKKREHTAPLPINFPSWPMAGTEEIKEIT